MIDLEKWVKEHLGRTVLFKRGNTDIVCRVVGSVVGRDMLGDKVIVEIIDVAYKLAGWSFIGTDDNIMLNCDKEATFLYAGIDSLYLQPKAFELPAKEMLDALDILTRNFSLCAKATEYDRKLIKECISNLKAKIYELK